MHQKDLRFDGLKWAVPLITHAMTGKPIWPKWSSRLYFSLLWDSEGGPLGLWMGDELPKEGDGVG